MLFNIPCFFFACILCQKCKCILHSHIMADIALLLRSRNKIKYIVNHSFISWTLSNSKKKIFLLIFIASELSCSPADRNDFSQILLSHSFLMRSKIYNSFPSQYTKLISDSGICMSDIQIHFHKI